MSIFSTTQKDDYLHTVFSAKSSIQGLDDSDVSEIVYKFTKGDNLWRIVRLIDERRYALLLYVQSSDSFQFKGVFTDIESAKLRITTK